MQTPDSSLQALIFLECSALRQEGAFLKFLVAGTTAGVSRLGAVCPGHSAVSTLPWAAPRACWLPSRRWKGTGRRLPVLSKTLSSSREVVGVGTRVQACQANNDTSSWNQELCAHYVTGRRFLTASRLRLTTRLELENSADEGREAHRHEITCLWSLRKRKS